MKDRKTRKNDVVSVGNVTLPRVKWQVGEDGTVNWASVVSVKHEPKPKAEKVPAKA